MSQLPVSLQAFGLVCAAGSQKALIRERLCTPDMHALRTNALLIPEHSVYTGSVEQALAAVPEKLHRYASRTLQLTLTALEPLLPALEQARHRYGPARIGIVLGTSTSGIAEGEHAIQAWSNKQPLPASYDYAQQEMGALALALRQHLAIDGPAYCISTACSASAKALASAQHLINANLCDVVISGGADSLCRLTLNGFQALESLSKTVCRPFSADRDGINIGEGAALFLVSREDGPLQLLSSGESCDAYHISAPHPEGLGAERAMQMALSKAGLPPAAINYINLHGTGTRQNDAMEARAVHRLFGTDTAVSSTKPLTGHTLGAAGAIEAALCLLLLGDEHDGRLPPHPARTKDPDLPLLHYASSIDRLPRGAATLLSNSFAFGGSNIALVLGRA